MNRDTHVAARTYADHLREWDAARLALAEARGYDDPKALAGWLHKNAPMLLDAAENLLDATAFKDSAALRRQTEIVQRIGAGRAA